MTFSNFKIDKTIMKYNIIWEEYGTVDITTGVWLWKKTNTHQVFKTAMNWKFVETGKWTPGLHVENLERSYKAKIVLGVQNA